MMQKLKDTHSITIIQVSHSGDEAYALQIRLPCLSMEGSLRPELQMRSSATRHHRKLRISSGWRTFLPARSQAMDPAIPGSALDQ